MTLTPFNPNIFFQRAAAERNQANQLQSAIGKLASAYANRDNVAMNKKMREMQIQKLENDMQTENVDFKSAAERVAMANASGQTPNEKDMMLVQAGAMMYPAQKQYDPATGGVLEKQTPYSSILGAMKGGYEYTPNLPRKGAFSQVPQIDAAMLNDGASLSSANQSIPMPAMGAQDGSIAPKMAAPKGVNITAPQTPYPKSQVAAETAAAKANIGLQEKAAQKSMEKASDRPSAERAVQNAFTDFGIDAGFIDKAIDQVSPYTAGGGSYLGMLAGTPASDLRNTLSTIQADSAFGRLQQMRETSKTGGALGSVSERELLLLQNAAAPLGQDQSPTQLKENLQKYKKVRQNALKQVAEAFKQDYGYYPKGIKLEGNAVGVKEGQSPEEINSLLDYMSPEERALFNGQ